MDVLIKFLKTCKNPLGETVLPLGPYLGEVHWSSGNDVEPSQLVQEPEALFRHLDLKIKIYSEQRRFL